jgi:hypothetical protein
LLVSDNTAPACLPALSLLPSNFVGVVSWIELRLQADTLFEQSSSHRALKRRRLATEAVVALDRRNDVSKLIIDLTTGSKPLPTKMLGSSFENLSARLKNEGNCADKWALDSFRNGVGVL